MATKEAIKARVLNVFDVNFHNGLMAEEVFPLYEELYGTTSRSNSIHTTLSQLTKEGHLVVTGKKLSTLTHKVVNVWNRADKSSCSQTIPVVVPENSKKQLQSELDLLKRKNATLEETNMKLLAVIEQVRAELATAVGK